MKSLNPQVSGETGLEMFGLKYCCAHWPSVHMEKKNSSPVYFNHKHLTAVMCSVQPCSPNVVSEAHTKEEIPVSRVALSSNTS